ncbi:hypothetical protein ACFVAJ_11055 [Agromyces sp. NPDC057679]|uniref:hypothetical protein n=1 Tax=Agromyces sp. NPDC057679 TaxID=3346207 RepID=UPI00367073AA
MVDTVNDARTELRPGREAAVRGLVLEHIEDSRERNARRRRRRRLVWGGIAVLAVGLGAATTVMWLQSQVLPNDHVIHCLRSEALADDSAPDAMAYISFDDDAGRVERAIEVCTLMWEQGALEAGFDPTSLTNAPGVVPEAFVLCRMVDQSTAVVPSREPSICSRLGLALLEASDRPPAR